MKQKLLFLSPVLPADDKGIRKRALMHLTALTEKYDVDLVVISRAKSFDLHDVSNCHEIVQVCNSVQLYAAHGKYYTAYRRTNKFKNRYIRNLLKAFCYPLSAMPLDQGEVNDLTEILSKKTYDLLFAFRLSTGLAFPALAKRGIFKTGVKSILDFDDIESKAKQRDASSRRKKEGLINTLLKILNARQLKKAEDSLVQHFERILVCSTDDQTELSNRFNSKKIRTIPNAVPDFADLCNSSMQQQNNILFVGSMDHGPNVDAIEFLIEEILPHITKILPEVIINIVGRHPNPKVLKFTPHPNVKIHSDVPDLAPYYNEATLVVAPIRYGGGTRLKIIEAMSFKKPIVATTIGAEGIAGKAEHDFLLADTPSDFADKCIQLMSDKSRQHHLAGNAYRLFKEQYSFNANIKRTTEIIDQII